MSTDMEELNILFFPHWAVLYHLKHCIGLGHTVPRNKWVIARLDVYMSEAPTLIIVRVDFFRLFFLGRAFRANNLRCYVYTLLGAYFKLQESCKNRGTTPRLHMMETKTLSNFTNAHRLCTNTAQDSPKHHNLKDRILATSPEYQVAAIQQRVPAAYIQQRVPTVFLLQYG